MNILMRALKPFGYHDDHAVGELVPVKLRDVEEVVKKGYAEIVVNNMGNNLDYNEHQIDGELYPDWVTAESLEPLKITPTPGPTATRCGVCNEDIDVRHCALHKAEKDGSITSYHMHHEGQLKDIKPCTFCEQHRVVCDECKEAE